MPLEKGHYPTWETLCSLLFYIMLYDWKACMNVRQSKLPKSPDLYVVLNNPCACASSHCRFFFNLYNIYNKMWSSWSVAKRLVHFFDCSHFRTIFSNRFILLSWRMVLNVQLSDLDSWMLSLYLSSNLWSHSWCF